MKLDNSASNADLPEQEKGDEVNSDNNHVQLNQKAVGIELPQMLPVFGTKKTDVRDGSAHSRPLSEYGNALRMIDQYIGTIYFLHEARVIHPEINRQ